MAEPVLPDALLTLRAAVSSSLPITLVSLPANTPAASLGQCTHIAFPSLATAPHYPRATPTRFLERPNLDHDDPASATYDLATLYFGYLQRDKTTADYLRLARAENVGFVSVTDRKMVVDWLAAKSPLAGPETRIRALDDAARAATERVLPEFERAADGPDGHAVDSASTTAGAGATAGGLAAEGGSRQQPGGPPMKKARYTADKGDQDKVKRMLAIMDGPQYGHVVAPNESSSARGSAAVDKVGGGGAHHTRETVLRGERYNNFDSVRSLIVPRLQTLQAAISSSSSKSGQASSTSQPGALKPTQSASAKKKQLNPIIMISPSSTALITMHNVKDFLQDARFIPSDQARSIAAGASTGYLAEDVVQVNHNRASGSTSTASTNGAKNVETRQARYFVVDSVEALAKFGGPGKEEEAWERVVCVMTTGQEWQFKSYKWKEPKELFHHVKGVYPQWSSDPANAKVKAWNIAELPIEPHKRYKDKSVVAEFWRNLESWISVNKPWLSY